MAHIWTFRVPEEYRVKGEGYVAISLFQADDHVANPVEGVREVIAGERQINEPHAQTFWDSLQEYQQNRHPMEIYLEDIICGGWALIWLTQEEFEAGSTELPKQEQCTFPGYKSYDGTSCFAQDLPSRYVQLSMREGDPNIGRMLEDFPDESDENAYISMFSQKGKELDLQKKFFGKTHFGGTANPVQATPKFSPFYIEFEEAFGKANMGGGNGQIDLLNDQLDWACG